MCVIILTTNTKECLLVMKILRETCREWKHICCDCANIVDNRMQRTALRTIQRFPHYFSANNNKMRVIPMNAWVTRGMSRFRQEWQHKWDDAMRIGIAQEFTIAKDDVEISNMLGLNNLQDFNKPHQCYNLFSHAKNEKLCVAEREIVHVELNSVILWFKLYGWDLDTCAALLFCESSTKKFDAGSSWMMLSIAIEKMIECHNCIEELASYFVYHIRNGKENILHNNLHRDYGCDWTAKLHMIFFSLRILTPFHPNSTISCYNYSFLQFLSRDTLSLEGRLLEEIVEVGGSAHSINTFSRKLNACIPLDMLIREACKTY